MKLFRKSVFTQKKTIHTKFSARFFSLMWHEIHFHIFFCRTDKSLLAFSAPKNRKKMYFRDLIKKLDLSCKRNHNWALYDNNSD